MGRSGNRVRCQCGTYTPRPNGMCFRCERPDNIARTPSGCEVCQRPLTSAKKNRVNVRRCATCETAGTWDEGDGLTGGRWVSVAGGIQVWEPDKKEAS